jgi:hypothetical protein
MDAPADTAQTHCLIATPRRDRLSQRGHKSGGMRRTPVAMPVRFLWRVVGQES